jgi:serine/threonine protein phosphatase PrpC
VERLENHHLERAGKQIAGIGLFHSLVYYRHRLNRSTGIVNLPLGAIPGAEFKSIRFRLEPDDSLLLLTDGVVEAQSPSGEFFGFDRTAAITTHSAQDIAAAAQAFGQEDDITVLTLNFAGDVSKVR